MTLTVVILDKNENFLQFLDTDLLELEETIEKGGIRTLTIDYTFQDFDEDKELFKIGNKIWVQGDKHLNNCLYVINTEVTENIYDENKFSLDVEEVLVELNYAPLFDQTELLTKDTNQQYLFKRTTTNGQSNVTVNWNALNYWFGDYFNIGIVQDCLTEYGSKIHLNGTTTLMSLLRYIEEETGNIFVTRYEKDRLSNQIHRYLDFLNPISVNRNWYLHLEYDFVEDSNVGECFDKDDKPTKEDEPWEVTPFDDQGHEKPYYWNPEDEANDDDWFDKNKDYTPLVNLDPAVVEFRITNKDGEVLNSDGGIYADDGDYSLSWSSSDVSFTDNIKNIVISLCRTGKNIGVCINGKSFAVAPSANYVGYPKSAVQPINNGTLAPVYISDDDDTLLDVAIPDDSYFEIYDTDHDVVLFTTELNTEIGHIHEEVLDFTYNMESVEYNIDETDTYTSISPVLSLDKNNDASNKLTYSDMSTIIEDWKNLAVTKGQTIPMIIQKENVQANNISTTCDTTYAGVLIDKVKCKLGNFDKTRSPNRSMSINNNYWSRPLKPQDQLDTQTVSKSTFEFWRGTSYWRAPFTKHKGELHVETDATLNTQYTGIRKRGDRRRVRGTSTLPKNGTVETSEEDPYAIYNRVAMKLKQKQYPKFSITVEVSNFKNGEYNNYQLHDKVYVKLPGNNEMVSARITKTVKNAKEISKNTVELDNYSINTVKTIQENTYIEAPNYSFHYPSSATLTARLVNADYDSTQQYSVHYPANRLIKVIVYRMQNGTKSGMLKAYTKVTNSNGYIKLPMKWKPGNYHVQLNYGGDEQYLECSHTVRVNVSGQVETKELKEKAKVKFKTTKKNNKNTTTKTVTTYWTKCGKSPIQKKGQKSKEVIAIARPSAGAGDYEDTWWKTVFKNKCPQCGGEGALVYDSGTSKTECVYCGSFGGSKRTWNGGIPEGEITCMNGDCCSDFDGVTGWEKDGNFSSRLTTVKKPVRSSKAEMYKLLNGKLVYKTKKVTVKKQNVNNSKNRKRICNNIPRMVVNKTLSIIGNKTGQAAALEICKFMGQEIGYWCYSDFQRGPISVLSNGRGNCCDQTRLMLQMFDVAGLSEFYTMKYVHVSTEGRGHVFAKMITKKTGSWRYVDPCKSEPWNNYVHGYGEPPGSQYDATSNNLLYGIF